MHPSIIAPASHAWSVQALKHIQVWLCSTCCCTGPHAEPLRQLQHTKRDNLAKLRCLRYDAARQKAHQCSGERRRGIAGGPVPGPPTPAAPARLASGGPCIREAMRGAARAMRTPARRETGLHPAIATGDALPLLPTCMPCPPLLMCGIYMTHRSKWSLTRTTGRTASHSFPVRCLDRDGSGRCKPLANRFLQPTGITTRDQHAYRQICAPVRDLHLDPQAAAAATSRRTRAMSATACSRPLCAGTYSP